MQKLSLELEDIIKAANPNGIKVGALLDTMSGRGGWLPACSSVFTDSVSLSSGRIYCSFHLAYYSVGPSDNDEQKPSFLTPEGSQQKHKPKNNCRHPEERDSFLEKD